MSMTLHGKPDVVRINGSDSIIIKIEKWNLTKGHVSHFSKKIDLFETAI